MIVAFRRKVQPGLVLLYAAIEGVFIGMISKVFENMYSGIVVQAVIGTFAAAASPWRRTNSSTFGSRRSSGRS
jgi:uncharacterized YccA/Bax inhibitor family protein